jgi:hypothetical protein
MYRLIVGACQHCKCKAIQSKAFLASPFGETTRNNARAEPF